MLNKVFIDTSGWAELFVASESYHQQAKEWFAKARKQKDDAVALSSLPKSLLLNIRMNLSIALQGKGCFR